MSYPLRYAYLKPVCIAAPMPTLYGMLTSSTRSNRRTISAVRSWEPSSITTMSYPGTAACNAATTEAIVSSSLYAGMITRVLGIMQWPPR